MSKEPSELETIDPDAMQTVQGGVTQAATDPNAQMTMMLQQVLSSIQDLAKSQQSGDGGMQQMMMMMMMMGGMGGSAPAPAAPTVAVGGVTPDGWTRVS
jgi:hypothetical protein